MVASSSSVLAFCVTLLRVLSCADLDIILILGIAIIIHLFSRVLSQIESFRSKFFLVTDLD